MIAWSECSLLYICRWTHTSSFIWFLVKQITLRMPLHSHRIAIEPPSSSSSVCGHLDRRERQFITPQHGKDKPHLMKQPEQSCIKSHRTVSCSAICTLPSSQQWVSGTADASDTVGPAASLLLLLAAWALLVKYCHSLKNDITGV